MVQKNDDSLEVLLSKVVKLLRDNNAPEWAAVLSKLWWRYVHVPTERNEVAKIVIKIICGGMGSLGDVVIQDNNGNIFEKENEEFEELLNLLYKKCKARTQGMA